MSNNLNFNSGIPTDISSLMTNLDTSQVDQTSLSPLQITDQISLANLFPNLNGSQAPTLPVLSTPLEITPQRPDVPTRLSEDEFNNLLQQALPEFSEFADLSNLLPKGPNKQDLVNRLNTALNSGKLNAFNFSAQVGKAIGQMIMQEIQKNPQSAKELTLLLDSVRVKTFGETFPAINIAIDKKAEQFMKEGASKEEAYQQARSAVLNIIDTSLKEQGVFQTVLGNHPKLIHAINEATVEVLGESFGEITGDVLSLGIAGASDLENAISSFFEQVSVNQTGAITSNQVIGTEEASTIVKGVVNTIDVIKRNGDLALQTLNPGMSADIKTTHSNWLRNLEGAIQELKTILNDMEMEEAKKSEALTQQKNQLTDLQHKVSMKKLADQMKELSKPAIVRFFEKLGKILASAIMSIIGALLTPFTGGASLAIVVAVTVLLFVLTTVLSETGILTKAFASLMQEIAKSLEASGASPAAQAAVKFLVALAMVVIVVIATIVCRSGAAASSMGAALSSKLATSLSEQVATQLVKFSALQIGTTMIGTLATSSGLFESFAQMTTNDKIKQAYIAMALNIVFTIALAGATIKSSMNDLNKAVEDGVKSSLSMINKMADAGEITKTAAEKFSKLTSTDEIKRLCDSLLEAGELTAKAANKINQALPTHSVTDISKVLMKVQGVATVVEAGTSVAGAAFAMKTAELAKEVKELEGQIELLKKMIQSLEKILADATDSMTDMRKVSTELGKFFDGVLSNLGETLSKLTAA